LHSQFELSDLIVDREFVTEHGAGKAALRADTELNELPHSVLWRMNPS
jgi:hypothetical protein